jgi:hypothetical protein
MEVPPDSREPTDPPPPPEDNLDWESWWTAARGEITTPPVAADRESARRAVVAEATPLLREVLYDEARNWRARVAAMTALARIGDASIVPFAKKIALADVESVRRELRESATLALGLLGRDDAATRAFLADVLRRGPRDESFVRPFAAVALGVAGDDPSRASAAALLDAVAREEPDLNVRPACLLALGLLDCDAVRPDLAAIVSDGRSPREGAEKLSDLERSFAVEALARIGGQDDATLGLLESLVRGRGPAIPIDVRRVAVSALGRSTSAIGADRRRSVVDLLVDVVADPSADDESRRLALVSLGRLGAAAPDAKAGTQIAAAILRLYDRLADGAAPFAATALGMIVRGGNIDDRVVARIRRRIDADARDYVRTTFDRVVDAKSDPAEDASASVGKSVALLRDPDAPGDGLRAAADALGEIGARDDVPSPARIATDVNYRAQVAAITELLTIL